jgi:hypothetical protein
MASTQVMRAGVRVAVALLSSEISTLLERKEKKKRSVWVREWIRKRNQLGASGTLMKELASGDSYSYKNHLRMSVEKFEELLVMAGPKNTERVDLV